MNDDVDISIITDFVRQLDGCHTVFDVSRAVIRNFVGYFMPEKAAYFLAPNASHPYFKCIDRYAVAQDLPQEITGNGGLISVTKSLRGAVLVSDIPIHNLIEAEQKIVLQFQYIFPIYNHSHYAGILLFSNRGGKQLALNNFDNEFLQIISTVSAKTFFSLVKPVDLHLDKVTKLYTKDFLWAMMDHHKFLCRELMQNKNIAFDLNKKVLPRTVLVQGQNKEDIYDIGYTIILIKVLNLNEINAKFDFEKGNQVLQQFGLELRLVFRRGDVPSRYEGSQFIVLLPLTKKEEAKILRAELEKLIPIVKLKQHIPVNFPVTIKCGFAHFPTDGEENYLLIQKAEKDLNENSTAE